MILFYIGRDAYNILQSLYVWEDRNLMYLVFVAYYDSMIFSEIICSEGCDFSRIIEIALLFHLQLSKTGWPDWTQMGQMYSGTKIVKHFISN